MLKNWKTTLGGIVALLGVAAKLYQNPQSFGSEDVAAVAAGIGLIFAKDSNVTGGTTPQTTEAVARVAAK